MNKQMTPAEIELLQQGFARLAPISDTLVGVKSGPMATTAEHSRSYRTRWHEHEIVRSRPSTQTEFIYLIK